MATVSTISGEECDVCGEAAACEVRAAWHAGKSWAKGVSRGLYTYILCVRCVEGVRKKADREAQLASEFSDAITDWQDAKESAGLNPEPAS